MVADIAPLSKGDFHLALTKNRKRIAHIDDIEFFGQHKQFMELMDQTADS